MLRQYYAQRCVGGTNPLRVGVIAIGSIYYLQSDGYFRDRYAGQPSRRTPWIIEALFNGIIGASRRNRETDQWESTYASHRSDFALLRSLRDRTTLRRVAIHTLILHDELGLWKEVTRYPTLPDVMRFRPKLFAILPMPAQFAPQPPAPHAGDACRRADRSPRLALNIA